MSGALTGQALAAPTVVSSPSGNIRCTIERADDGLPRLVCQRLNDRRSVVLAPEGVGIRAGELGVTLPRRRPISYGTTFRTANFACLSDVQGMACQNRDGNGFAMSRSRLDLLSAGSAVAAIDLAFADPLPEAAIAGRPARAPAPRPAPRPACDPNYAGACVPIVSGDLDCRDIGYQTVRVVGADVHRFDGDRDGIGCE